VSVETGLMIASVNLGESLIRTKNAKVQIFLSLICYRTTFTMFNMVLSMKVNLTNACKMVGISRTTMYNKYVKSGVLSVQKIDKQVFIDVSELIRVFGNIKQLGEHGNVQEMLPMDVNLHAKSNDLTTENARLKAENEQLKARLDDKDKHLQDMRNTILLIEHNKKFWWKFW
jgi:hypothetical protein